jgi:O-antigen ligase
MVASQAGLLGLTLLIGWLLAQLRTALRQGDAGVPALLVWLAMAGAGLFNVVLRDAKFGVPLLMLAALATAAARLPAAPVLSQARR